jgi:hypothetical protein
MSHLRALPDPGEPDTRSLLDLLEIYRQCVSDLAAQNLSLREEVAVLRALSTDTWLTPAGTTDLGSLSSGR